MGDLGALKVAAWSGRPLEVLSLGLAGLSVLLPPTPLLTKPKILLTLNAANAANVANAVKLHRHRLMCIAIAAKAVAGPIDGIKSHRRLHSFFKGGWVGHPHLLLGRLLEAVDETEFHLLVSHRWKIDGDVPEGGGVVKNGGGLLEVLKLISEGLHWVDELEVGQHSLLEGSPISRRTRLLPLSAPPSQSRATKKSSCKDNLLKLMLHSTCLEPGVHLEEPKGHIFLQVATVGRWSLGLDESRLWNRSHWSGNWRRLSSDLVSHLLLNEGCQLIAVHAATLAAS